MLTAKEQQVLNSLSPMEKRTLENAKTLLKALVVGSVRGFGGIFCDKDMNSLRMGCTDMHDAVRLLQNLGCSIERADAGGSPTWILTKLPKGF